MSDDNSPVNEAGRTEDGSSPGSRASSRAPPPLSKSDAEQCIVLAKVDITAHVSPPMFFKAKAIEIDSLAAEEDVRWVALTSVPKTRRGPHPSAGPVVDLGAVVRKEVTCTNVRGTMHLAFVNKTFRGSETTWANACVGENGAPGIIDYASGFAAAANALLDSAIATEGIELTVDTLVYPVCFTMRHAIELFLKSAAKGLISIGEMRGVALPSFSHKESHDLGVIWRYVKGHALMTDERLAEIVRGLDEYVLDVAAMDASGQVFRYPFDLENKKHLTEIGIINFLVLKVRFNEVERLLLALSRMTEKLVEEYRWGTFTKKLSRHQLHQLATELPPRLTWQEASFDDVKATLMAKYKLSSNDFSKALKLIQQRHEMATCIGIQVPIPGFTLVALLRFFDHWCKVNELKHVFEPPPPRIVGSGELHDALRDHATPQVSAKALASEISFEEFAAIQALFEFEGEAPVSEDFDRVLSIYQKRIEHHRADPDEYLRVLSRMMGKMRAFEKILYSLDMLGQTAALEAVLARYGLEPARERLLERSQRHKRIDA